MFARYLELDLEEEKACFVPNRGENYGCGGFEYEPASLLVNGWHPDFLLWTVKCGRMNGTQLPGLRHEIIEYKPSRPTDTYIEEFATRCQVLLEQWFHDQACRCYLYWGSVFTADRGIATVGRCGVESVSAEDWLVNYEDQIRNTRFDLMVQSSM
jgi:hypothetical protein